MCFTIKKKKNAHNSELHLSGANQTESRSWQCLQYIPLWLVSDLCKSCFDWSINTADSKDDWPLHTKRQHWFSEWASWIQLQMVWQRFKSSYDWAIRTSAVQKIPSTVPHLLYTHTHTHTHSTVGCMYRQTCTHLTHFHWGHLVKYSVINILTRVWGSDIIGD